MKKYFECSEFSGSQQHAKSRRRGYDGHFAELFTDNQSPDAQSTTHRFPLLPTQLLRVRCSIRSFFRLINCCVNCFSFAESTLLFCQSKNKLPFCRVSFRCWILSLGRDELYNYHFLTQFHTCKLFQQPNAQCC